jgi:4-hydroxy-tetrahydrodipicolinate reductase
VSTLLGVIKVGVFGAGGRMGATVCQAVLDADDMELVAAVDTNATGIVEGTDLAISTSIDAMKAADVAVDFTVIDAARENLQWCAANGVHAVVGTSGFSEDELAQLENTFDGSTANAAIVPNFAIGAVLMIRFAELAAPFFENVEIIEMHHNQKIDAPSGTAIATARRIAAASEEWAEDPTTKMVAEGARGSTVDGIPVHAVRLRGMVASQEVLLGTTGQSLSIRHDTYDRSSFMPGVLLAIRRVGEIPGLTIGLDPMLGL